MLGINYLINFTDLTSLRNNKNYYQLVNSLSVYVLVSFPVQYSIIITYTGYNFLKKITDDKMNNLPEELKEEILSSLPITSVDNARIAVRSVSDVHDNENFWERKVKAIHPNAVKHKGSWKWTAHNRYIKVSFGPKSNPLPFKDAIINVHTKMEDIEHILQDAKNFALNNIYTYINIYLTINGKEYKYDSVPIDEVTLDIKKFNTVTQSAIRETYYYTPDDEIGNCVIIDNCSYNSVNIFDALEEINIRDR